MSATLTEPVTTSNVGMGQVLLARGPDRLNSILGSCMGVSLYHERLKVGALAHIVLAESAGRDGTPGKFADTAIPHMLKLLAAEGANSGGIVAKIAGGASMFNSTGPIQVGDSNIQAVKQLLAAAQIQILAEHVGGNKGRRITLDCQTGQVNVEIAGRAVETM